LASARGNVESRLQLGTVTCLHGFVSCETDNSVPQQRTWALHQQHSSSVCHGCLFTAAQTGCCMLFWSCYMCHRQPGSSVSPARQAYCCWS
jgi:hypothetical protein